MWKNDSFVMCKMTGVVRTKLKNSCKAFGGKPRAQQPANSPYRCFWNSLILEAWEDPLFQGLVLFLEGFRDAWSGGRRRLYLRLGPRGSHVNLLNAYVMIRQSTCQVALSIVRASYFSWSGFTHYSMLLTYFFPSISQCWPQVEGSGNMLCD